MSRDTLIDLIYRELHRLLDWRAEFGWLARDKRRFAALENMLWLELDAKYCQ